MAAADAVASAQLGLLLESKEHELQQIQEIERLGDELVAGGGTPGARGGGDRVECPNCLRVVSSARFAPHLDKCLQNARLHPGSDAASAGAAASASAPPGSAAASRGPAQPHSHAGSGIGA